MFLPLPKSYKGIYPFRLATTSYIYPDHIYPNVKMLAPYLDEIELLLFESDPDGSLPSKDEIKQLSLLAEKTGIAYNVHLPIDTSISDPDPSKRLQDVETIKRVMDLTSPLEPSTYTLHLPYDGHSDRREDVRKWQELISLSMEQIIGEGISGKYISIETLMYPFERVAGILAEFDLSVCIDTGHILLQDIDLKTFYNNYDSMTSIIHLHGVQNGHDHLSLDKLPENPLIAVMEILKRFTGVVSLEVFSYENLKRSLAFLEKCWQEL